MWVFLGDTFGFVNKSHLQTEYKILLGNEDETQIIRDIKSGAVDLFMLGIVRPWQSKL